MQRRKNYLINKKFQLNVLFQLIVLLVLESALIVGLFMQISRDTLTTGYLDLILRVERTQDFFFTPLLLMTLIVVVGIGIAGIIVFTLLTHRIAGPLYRFEKVLKQIGAGDVSKKFDLRKLDQLTHVEQTLNALIDSLDARMKRVKRELIELQKLASKAGDSTALSEIQEKIKHIKNEIDYFKVSSDPKNGR